MLESARNCIACLDAFFVLAPSGQLEGNSLGGCEAAEFAWASSAGNRAQAGLAEDVADGSSAKVLGSNLFTWHPESRSCLEVLSEN